MKRSEIKLTKSEQDQILQASYEPGCIISELAKQYGISSKIIYNQYFGQFYGEITP
jgi:transposase-like protein